jgi:hypothetical protein
MEATDSRLSALENAQRLDTQAFQFLGQDMQSIRERLTKLEQAPTPVPAPVGPRVALGADVPLNLTDQALPSVGIRPLSLTTAGIQAAITRAASGSRVVFLPAGGYAGGILRVPAGVTIIGEGSRSVIQSNTQTFLVEGAGVRLTRLKLLGAAQAWSETNNSRAIENYDFPGLRVDCCDIAGFSYGIFVSGLATARVEQCRISNCLRAGLGYGVLVAGGAWVRIADTEISNCRHTIASNGVGMRPPQWEAIHCRLGDDSLVPASVRQGAVDTHPGMNGAFVLERTVIEQVAQLGEISDGTGLVTGCRLADAPMGFRLWARSQDGKTGLPRDVRFEGNEWASVPSRFVFQGAANIRVDGQIAPETLRPDLPPLPPMPRLAVSASGGLELR